MTSFITSGVAGDPEQGLVDGQRAQDFGGGWVGWKLGPEGGVLRAAVGAGAEEQAGAAGGELVEVRRVRAEGPVGAVGDKGKVVGDGGAHARAVFELVVPDAVEARGEQEADRGEHVEVEERVAVGASEVSSWGKLPSAAIWARRVLVRKRWRRSSAGLLFGFGGGAFGRGEQRVGRDLKQP